jgi:hypothetical protein
LPAIDAAATAWTGPGGADPGDRRDPARQAGRPAPRGCRWFVLALFLAVLWRPLAGVANGIIHRGSRSPEGIVMKTFNDHGRAILICAGATIVATARADGRVGLEMDYDGDGVTDEARTVRWSRLTR